MSELQAGEQTQSAASPGVLGGSGGHAAPPNGSGSDTCCSVWLELAIAAERFYTLSTYRKSCLTA